MPRLTVKALMAATALLALGACDSNSFQRELGAQIDQGDFGSATMNNTLVQNGERDFAVALAERFNATVTDTITFAFNSAQITAESAAILEKQAHFIRQFPEVRFKVFGHTDLVGGQSFNHALGQRRANAVVSYLVNRGVPRARLEAVVSYGKTRPLIQTSQPEQRNRRTVTEVSGFVKNAPGVLNGHYAAIVMREYVQSATPRHPSITGAQTQTAAGTGG